ncbi:hypothetical protein [Planococcus lenghuensis]|uniref:Uncharacterized protein n=1 Tax=Planococcus lenghuensis TaxID=2213202 RepID=A0A1Q2L5B7_9BACL|nr:hypothetical protein [Planococcus lenghuensis]AQQ55564.1 hypothetical protein B0X71_20535 [Planococcus lenghuensis]
MRKYGLDELFDVLKRHKITTNKESVRRWLREGKINGSKGAGPRRNGWWVTEADLMAFLKERLPDHVNPELPEENQNTTTVVVTEEEKEEIREEARQELLGQLAAKNIWEGRFQLKKSFVNACLDHRRIENRGLRTYILNRMMQHKGGYATPGVLYLLDTFKFDGERLPFDSSFGSLDEQVVYSLIDHLQQEYVNPNRRKGE